MKAKIGQSILRIETFRDSSGNPITLSGTTSSVVKDKTTGTMLGNATATIKDANAGQLMIVVPSAITGARQVGDLIEFDAKVVTDEGYVFYTRTFVYEMEQPIT